MVVKSKGNVPQKLRLENPTIEAKIVETSNGGSPNNGGLVRETQVRLGNYRNFPLEIYKYCWCFRHPTITTKKDGA